MIAAAAAPVAPPAIVLPAASPPAAVFRTVCLPFVKGAVPEDVLAERLHLRRDAGSSLSPPFAWQHMYRVPGADGRLSLTAASDGRRSCSFDYPEGRPAQDSPLAAALDGAGWRAWRRPSPSDGAANPIFCAATAGLHATFNRTPLRNPVRMAGIALHDWPRDPLCGDGPP